MEFLVEQFILLILSALVIVAGYASGHRNEYRGGHRGGHKGRHGAGNRFGILRAQKRTILENPNIFEGDILLLHGDPMNAVPRDAQLWPEGTIPYELDDKYTDKERGWIKEAMKEYADKTCIKFKKRDENTKDYIHVRRLTGCNSYIGKVGGAQRLTLSPGCFGHSTIVHELLHSIGFYHEHNRSDRDQYVDIHWDSIIERSKGNFIKLRPDQNRLILKFDYDSVMLYGETFFSKNKATLKTMTHKDPTIKLKELSQKPGLSEDDVKKIKILYKC